MPVNATEGTSASKRARLEARITVEQKELLQRAADLTGRSLTDFVVASAQDAANRIVRDSEIMVLSKRDSEAFVAALLRPAAPGPRLRKAMKEYKAAVGRK